MKGPCLALIGYGTTGFDLYWVKKSVVDQYCVRKERGKPVMCMKFTTSTNIVKKGRDWPNLG